MTDLALSTCLVPIVEVPLPKDPSTQRQIPARQHRASSARMHLAGSQMHQEDEEQSALSEDEEQPEEGEDEPEEDSVDQRYMATAKWRQVSKQNPQLSVLITTDSHRRALRYRCNVADCGHEDIPTGQDRKSIKNCRRRMQNHALVYHSDKIHECKVLGCDEQCETYFDYLRHTSQKHPRACHKCGAKFKTEEYLANHFDGHLHPWENTVDVLCQFAGCSKPFKGLVGLFSHQRTHHRDCFDEPSTSDPALQMCMACGVTPTPKLADATEKHYRDVRSAHLLVCPGRPARGQAIEARLGDLVVSLNPMVRVRARFIQTVCSHLLSFQLLGSDMERFNKTELLTNVSTFNTGKANPHSELDRTGFQLQMQVYKNDIVDLIDDLLDREVVVGMNIPRTPVQYLVNHNAGHREHHTPCVPQLASVVIDRTVPAETRHYTYCYWVEHTKIFVPLTPAEREAL